MNKNFKHNLYEILFYFAIGSIYICLFILLAEGIKRENILIIVISIIIALIMIILIIVIIFTRPSKNRKKNHKENNEIKD